MSCLFVWIGLIYGLSLPRADISNPAEVAQFLGFLKRVDRADKPIKKETLEAIFGRKFVPWPGVFPKLYICGITPNSSTGEGNGPFSAEFAPDGGYMFDFTVSVSPGRWKVKEADIESIWGKGVELKPNTKQWLIDPYTKNVSYERPYGSITCLYERNWPKNARYVYFWFRNGRRFKTLEDFEASRSSDQLLEDALLATKRGHLQLNSHRLFLSFQRAGFVAYGGERMRERWRRIKAAYVALYRAKGKPGIADYLINITCARMNQQLLTRDELNDFPTTSQDTDTWTIEHWPDSDVYKLWSNGVMPLDIYRSSPNFEKCRKLFGEGTVGRDITAKTIPADLYDDEFFGPVRFK